MAVPNTFATATSAIPLANLDANFAYYDGAFSISGTATTFAGSVTLTSGSANGVAYLNGSKVLTTGSALTFDGTTFYGANGKFGNGVATNTSKLMVNTTSGTAAGIQLFQDGIESWIMGMPASSGGLAWSNSGVEQMRLNSTGLGIGTSSPAYRLEAFGTTDGQGVFVRNSSNVNFRGYYIGATGVDPTSYGSLALNANSGELRLTAGNGTYGGYQTFYAAGSERARIDSSGNLLVNSIAISNSPARGVQLWSGSSNSIGGVAIGHDTGVASGNYYAIFNYASGIIGSITQSGTTAVLFNVTSDQRLKENIQDAASASALIDSLQVRQFDWKTDNSHQRYGFIAQELVTVAPEAVHQPSDPDEMMAVDYSKLVPMLVKEIQSLRKRLTALEST